MSGADQWLGMMASTVSVAHPSTAKLGPFGQMSYSTSVTKYRCRYSAMTARMRKTDGYDVNVKGVLWVNATSTGAIQTDSKLILPDGSVPSIIDVECPRDESGAVHHVKVLFG